MTPARPVATGLEDVRPFLVARGPTNRQATLSPPCPPDARAGRLPRAVPTLPAPDARRPETLRLHPPERSTDMVRRLLLLTYGILCYVLFLATFLYAVGFIGGVLSPTPVDGSRHRAPAAGLASNRGRPGRFAGAPSRRGRPRFQGRPTPGFPAS